VAVRLGKLLDRKPRFHLLHVGDGASPKARPAGGFDRIVRRGPVVETIVDVAGEVAADLIVMATAGHKSFMDALRGSTTEAVLRKARRPLLAVPEGFVPARDFDTRVMGRATAAAPPP
jgi:hypothetical protein